jgi:acyl-coenzyme A thioesterase PaaI-like protein
VSSPAGTGDTPAADADAVRERAAAALRRLGHAVVGHEADPGLLDRIATLAHATAATVETGAARTRPIESMKRRLWASPPADGQPMSHFAECVVSGAANPMGIAIQVRRAGDGAVADFNLGPAFEGAPGRAHGGVVAAVFDDVMGYVLVIQRTPAYTGRLTVRYRAPVPVGADLTVLARLVRREGRKLWMESQMLHGDECVAEADALFIVIPPERLGLPPAQ